MRKTFLACAVAAGAILGAAPSAQAGGYGHGYQGHAHYGHVQHRAGFVVHQQIVEYRYAHPRTFGYYGQPVFHERRVDPRYVTRHQHHRSAVVPARHWDCY